MNHINNINELEKKMIELLSLSLTQSLSKKNLLLHPIRLTDALKAIIGIDLEKPNKYIIDFINKIKLSDIGGSREYVTEYQSKTVSIYQLKEAINESDFDKINNLSDTLLQLSDGRHILEYLVELSLEQRGDSILVVWAIYKAINFIGYSDRENTRNAIRAACQCLIFDDFRNTSKDKKMAVKDIPLRSIQSSKQLYILGVLHEINNFEFIRKDLIMENASSFADFFYNHENNLGNVSNSLIATTSKKVNILDLINEIEISEETVLCLNALRSISKYSHLSYKDARRFLDLITRSGI